MSENKYQLAKYDVSGIQSYIFATNRLRENVGASNNVRRILEKFLPEAIEEAVSEEQEIISDWANIPDWEFRLPQNEKIAAEIVYIGGGNAVVAYRHKTLCKEVARLLAQRTVEECRGVTVFAVSVETDFKNYAEDIGRLDEKLAEAKKKTPKDILLSRYPIVEQDTAYGLPIARSYSFGNDGPQNMSIVQYQKYNAFKHMDHKKYEGKSFAVEMADLARKKGEDSYVAVVHLDGNGMGDLIQRKMNENKEYAKAVPAIRKISNQIEELNKKTFKDVMDILVKNYDRKVLPFRPLILAGDDLTFICSAQLGLFVTARYLRRLMQLANGRLEYSACAGIAFVHNHFPFRIAYEIAEECCANAKKSWYNEKAAKKTAAEGYLDYCVVRGAYVKEMQKNDKEKRLRLRPIKVSREENTRDVNSIDKLCQLLNKMENGGPKACGWPRSRLKRLYEAYLKGPDELKFLEKEYFSRGYEIAKLVGIEEEAFDSHKPYGVFDALEIMDFYEEELYQKFLGNKRGGEEQ